MSIADLRSIACLVALVACPAPAPEGASPEVDAAPDDTEHQDTPGDSGDRVPDAAAPDAVPGAAPGAEPDAAVGAEPDGPPDCDPPAETPNPGEPTPCFVDCDDDTD